MNIKIAAFCLAISAFGIASAQAAQTWSVNVVNSSAATLACTDPGNPDLCLSGTGKTNVFQNGATITIICPDAATCADITLSRENLGVIGKEVQGRSAPSALAKVYALNDADLAAASNVGVFSKEKLLVAFTLQPGSRTDTTTTAMGSLQRAVSAMKFTGLQDCPPQVAAVYTEPEDDGGKTAIATIYVDVLGNVLAKTQASFDENDSLTVFVLGEEELVKTLKVARTSAMRDLTILRNIGEGTQIQRQAVGGAAPVCKMKGFEGIDSFAPGKGVVTISRAKNDAVEAIGTVELNVAPLYSGIFTMGVARTDIVNPKYKLVTNGSDNVIALGDASDTDTLYTVNYTPFVWGKRDLEKRMNGSNWYRHINPTIGLALDDVSNNFLVGVSIDLPRGVLITAGVHYRKIDVLSEESGFAVGDVFAGAADALPTSSKWDSDKFIAVSIDIRVMAQLIKSAFTTAAN